MKVTIFGTGYVGLTAGACLASVGNEVLCIDHDATVIEQLQGAQIPFFEPGLGDLVQTNAQAQRLTFSTDAAAGVAHGDVIFIAVGTPTGTDGAANLDAVFEVAGTIGRLARSPKIAVLKSTVPVGTADRLTAMIAKRPPAPDAPITMVANPEFLKEGAAVADFMKPDRVIVGASDPAAIESMRRLYAPFHRRQEHFLAMDTRSAELTKYAANAMLAARISLMNELALIAEQVDADIEDVRLGIGADPRIGFDFIYPGCGFGGSCLPKDLRALAHTARTNGLQPQFIDAITDVNTRQRQVLFQKIHAYFEGDLKGRRIAVWGLTFKPNTNDMREAPSIDLLTALWEAGASVVAYDPAHPSAAAQLAAQGKALTNVEDAYEAVAGADALAILTEWQEFRSPDFDRLTRTMATPLIFDGRNLYEPALVEGHGLAYYAIGRGRRSQHEIETG